MATATRSGAPRRTIHPLVTAVLLTVFIILPAACRGGQGATSAPGTASGSATPLPPVVADDRIIADGRVVPVRHADMSFATAGVVSEVLVM